jgi:hypothetical protein
MSNRIFHVHGIHQEARYFGIFILILKMSHNYINRYQLIISQNQPADLRTYIIAH